MTRPQIILAILADACLVIIPVCVFTGTFGNLNFLAINGLAGIWVGSLITALCLTA